MATAALRGAEFGYAAGFPQGRPGEVASRLLGRRTLYLRQRGAQAEPVLAWAEAGRTEGLMGPLAPGLVGAPMLDRDGAIVGVVLAEQPRRGRLYTSTPEAVAASLAAAKTAPAPLAAGFPLTPDNYGLAADDLRRALRIAAVACAAFVTTELGCDGAQLWPPAAGCARARTKQSTIAGAPSAAASR